MKYASWMDTGIDAPDQAAITAIILNLRWQWPPFCILSEADPVTRDTSVE